MRSPPGIAPGLADVGAEVSRSDQQSHLGRIPAGLPVITEAGVVAVADRLRKRPQRGGRPWSGAGGTPCSRSTASPPLQIRVTRIRFSVRVPVLSVQITSVEPKRLDRAETLDHGPLANEAAHADRQGQRDHRQQALRHVAHDQPDREDDGVADRQPGAERGHRDERDAGDHRDRSDQPGDPAHLVLERALLGLDPLRKRRDSPELGPHPGREDECSRLPAGAGDPAQDEIPGQDQWSVGVDEIRRAQ